MGTLMACPIHSHEDVKGVLVSRPEDWPEYAYTCPLSEGHPDGRPFTWLFSPELAVGESSGLAAELGLEVELPAVMKQYGHRWVEYGVVERAYALAKPADFALLVEKYGHTAIKGKRYTASSFLARALGDLSARSVLSFRYGPATGRWSYNSQISWWCLPPGPEWAPDLSWETLNLRTDYVPGSVE